MKPKPHPKPPREHLIFCTFLLAYQIAQCLCRPPRDDLPTQNLTIDMRGVSLNDVKEFNLNVQDIVTVDGTSLSSDVNDTPGSDDITYFSDVILRNDVIPTRDVVLRGHEVSQQELMMQQPLSDVVSLMADEQDIILKRNDAVLRGYDVNQQDLTMYKPPNDVDSLMADIDTHLSSHKRRHRSHPEIRRRRKRHKQHSRPRDVKPRRRDRFLLKADGPGHVIFSSREVKRDWCRTVPFNQTVEAGPRCRSKVVRNNLCYGQCNSFFIPQTGGRTANKVAFQSCSFCRPHRMKWVNVTLHCHGRHGNKVQKTILKVDSCRCATAEKDEMDRNLEYLRKGIKTGFAS